MRVISRPDLVGFYPWEHVSASPEGFRREPDGAAWRLLEEPHRPGMGDPGLVMPWTHTARAERLGAPARVDTLLLTPALVLAWHMSADPQF